MASAHPQIQLTETEDRFLSLLHEFATEGRLKVQPQLPEVECRIAGGWVRDKLLSLPSSDLDVTLSSVSGYDFATAFTTYLQSLDPPIPTRSIGKVAANPDQSKHLETAATKILGLDLDFVALRSETYANGSRIPSEVRLGTAEEDALRRDITINTLFYNVHSRQVEDWTGRGLTDMAARLIRTPLEPAQTFQDDPLRILRCIRFASRFGYELVPELVASLRDQDILDSLRTRISRERVGIEVEKMLKGPDPLLSIRLMVENGLFPHIFTIPPAAASPPHGVTDALRAGEIFAALLPGGSLNARVHPALLEKLSSEEPAAKTRRTALWLACTCTPFRGGVAKDKKKDVTMAEMVIKEGLKLGNTDKDAVTKLYAAVSRLSRSARADLPGDRPRSAIGMTLRESGVHDPSTETYWSTSTLFSMVLELVEAGNGEKGEAAAQSIIENYNAFTQQVLELGLPSAIEEKPRLDGNEINAALGIKPSALTRTLTTMILAHQLDAPSASKDECTAWLLAERDAGRIDMSAADAGKKGKHGMSGEGKAGGKKAKKE